jgi:hypothetical protein
LLTFWYINPKKVKEKECIHVTISDKGFICEILNSMEIFDCQEFLVLNLKYAAVGNLKKTSE